MEIGCAILAGGRSVRMGRDKATAEFRGGPLIRQVFDTVRQVFDDIIIISSIHETIEGIEAPVIRDVLPVQSPMVGIATALVHSSRPRVFVVACDMPLLCVEAIRCLVDEAEGEDITIPMAEGYYQPLHAIYGRSCLAPLLRLVGLGRLKVSDILPYVVVKAIKDRPCFYTPGGTLIFSNINTPEELAGINPRGA
ncbi:MAG: molybdenum cofactor guanylyltransferase [Syntrophorhabdus sp.]|nr:molybdenum cofactor guanylyltransferase [Syntrophorhabdus sp.]